MLCGFSGVGCYVTFAVFDLENFPQGLAEWNNPHLSHSALAGAVCAVFREAKAVITGPLSLRAGRGRGKAILSALASPVIT